MKNCLTILRHQKTLTRQLTVHCGKKWSISGQIVSLHLKLIQCRQRQHDAKTLVIFTILWQEVDCGLIIE